MRGKNGRFIKGAGFWTGRERPTGVNSSHWRGGLPRCKDCGKELTNYRPKGRCVSCYHKSRVGVKRSKEVIRKYLKRREKSSLEIKVEKIIQKNNLPYKFVGNGAFFIERKNPDFVNINGEKKAVEVYYRGHKEIFRKQGIDTWKQERIETFSRYGWQVIFIEASESDEKRVLEKLGGTNYG